MLADVAHLEADAAAIEAGDETGAGEQMHEHLAFLRPFFERAWRATARARIVPIIYDDNAPGAGTPVTAGDKPVGTLGSTARGRGLALLRLDRVADAMAQGVALESAGVPIRLVKPEWAQFPWPGE